mmetsp:Transcript_10297/g.30155  ORF Transcript_10297/g.30155 Transcript_10297/m.30155 type:complete len:405 (+) Transcript_10297:339-1553(+)
MGRIPDISYLLCCNLGRRLANSFADQHPPHSSHRAQDFQARMGQFFANVPCFSIVGAGVGDPVAIHDFDAAAAMVAVIVVIVIVIVVIVLVAVCLWFPSVLRQDVEGNLVKGGAKVRHQRHVLCAFAPLDSKIPVLGPRGGRGLEDLEGRGEFGHEIEKIPQQGLVFVGTGKGRPIGQRILVDVRGPLVLEFGSAESVNVVETGIEQDGYLHILLPGSDVGLCFALQIAQKRLEICRPQNLVFPVSAVQRQKTEFQLQGVLWQRLYQVLQDVFLNTHHRVTNVHNVNLPWTVPASLSGECFLAGLVVVPKGRFGKDDAATIGVFVFHANSQRIGVVFEAGFGYDRTVHGVAGIPPSVDSPGDLPPRFVPGARGRCFGEILERAKRLAVVVVVVVFVFGRLFLAF